MRSCISLFILFLLLFQTRGLVFLSFHSLLFSTWSCISLFPFSSSSFFKHVVLYFSFHSLLPPFSKTWSCISLSILFFLPFQTCGLVFLSFHSLLPLFSNTWSCISLFPFSSSSLFKHVVLYFSLSILFFLPFQRRGLVFLSFHSLLPPFSNTWSCISLFPFSSSSLFKHVVLYFSLSILFFLSFQTRGLVFLSFHSLLPPFSNTWSCISLFHSLLPPFSNTWSCIFSLFILFFCIFPHFFQFVVLYLSFSLVLPYFFFFLSFLQHVLYLSPLVFTVHVASSCFSLFAFLLFHILILIF